MRSLISIFMSLMLVFLFWTIAAGSVETPKDSKTEKKADTKASDTKKTKKQTALEANCGKCHKGDKDVKKINEAKGIKSSEEMIKLIRKGEKAKLHEKISDKNLKAVGNELFPQKKAADSKKDVKKDPAKTDADKQPTKPKKKPEGC
jgi:mono/diheme cytochrome c family protein